MGWSIGGQAPLMKCHLSSLLLFDTDGELPYPRPLHMRKKGIDKLYSTPMMTYDECGRYPVERRTATLAKHGIRSTSVLPGGLALIGIAEERVEGFDHFTLLGVLRYVETIENRVRFFRYGFLHGLMHQVDQPLMMVDHLAEEALIGIARLGSANRRHSRRLWIELGQREHSSGGEASAADGKPQAFHVSQVVISSACADRPGEVGLPSRQRLARLQLLRPSPKE